MALEQKTPFSRVLFALFVFLVPAVLFLRLELPGLFSNGKDILPGAVAPTFSLPDSSGHMRSLQDYLSKNKFVMLHFWATWCPTCNEEMPEVVELYRQLHASGVEFVAVSVDHDPAELRAYVNQHGLEFPVLSDSANTVMDQYNVSYLPTTFLLGSDGRVVARNIDIGQLPREIEKQRP
ncbi:MAG: TlpA family protein disulfide reductase [Deltaproteobacteria bacterium]|nr:TlpA family protein disulfide reductase [Deltaproteobacteria bacterium]